VFGTDFTAITALLEADQIESAAILTLFLFRLSNSELYCDFAISSIVDDAVDVNSWAGDGTRFSKCSDRTWPIGGKAVIEINATLPTFEGISERLVSGDQIQYAYFSKGSLQDCHCYKSYDW
jgi:hypothetical protein